MRMERMVNGVEMTMVMRMVMKKETQVGSLDDDEAKDCPSRKTKKEDDNHQETKQVG